MALVNSLHAPINRESLEECLEDFFGIREVRDVSVVHGGYRNQNFRVDTDKGVYFLKQYRNRINTIVHEIKDAEEFFAKHGLPVIQPVKDRFGREAFWMYDNWYSLFPFVNGTSPAYGQISMRTAESLAETLVGFHEVGKLAPHTAFQHIRMGNKRKFIMESVELEKELMRRTHRSPLEEKLLNLLRQKNELVKKYAVPLQNIVLPNDLLIHGDFQYQNVFIDDQGRVTHVYDLERACIAPRAYELARSLFINCFDDGWTDNNYALGRRYLEVYRSRLSLPFEEFKKGVDLYAMNIIHMSWIEARYLIFAIDTQLPILDRHARRVEFVARGLDDFCERVYGK